jgi:hypothetical protein
VSHLGRRKLSHFARFFVGSQRKIAIFRLITSVGHSPAKDKAKLKKKVLQIVSLVLVVRVQLFSFSNENNTSSFELKKILEEK